MILDVNRRLSLAWCLLIVLTLFISSNLSAVSEKKEKQIFSEAQADFALGLSQNGEQKRMTMLKAVSRFQVLEKEYGIKNGYLYYNIANAYYEAGEKGKAILNYRRGERLVPGFLDLKHNLSQARQDLNLPESKEIWWTGIVKSVFFWHYMFDYSTRKTIFFVAFISVWGVMGISIFLKHIFIRTALGLALFLVVCVGSSYLYSTYEIYFVRSGVMIEKECTVRKGPGKNYEKFYEQPLPGGTEFRFIETQGDWAKVKLLNREEVWLRADEIELI
ncbi:hypothetical protein KKA14_17220 [bacterium]|nr:hypothetical protein [bacterium]